MRGKLTRIKNSINGNRMDKIMFITLTIVVLGVGVWLLAASKRQLPIARIDVDGVWYGNDWFYENGKETQKGNREYYMKLEAENGRCVISKTVEAKLPPDSFLCFRVRAQEVQVYLNDKLEYEHSFLEEYKPYEPRMYILYQIPLRTLQAGDTITISLMLPDTDYFIMQYFSLGDRFEISKYVFRKAALTIAVCCFSLLLVILILIGYHSPMLMERIQGTKSVLWLMAFLILAAVWMITDNGCLELLTGSSAVIYWFNCVSLLMIPMPFIMYTKYTFFPDHIRFNLLAYVNVFIVASSMLGYLFYSYDITKSFQYMHLLIGVSIILCIICFFTERYIPSAEVIFSFAAIFIAAGISIISYWKSWIFPASTVFGYGLIIYSLFMLIWTVRGGWAMRRAREEAEKLRLEQEKEAAEQASEQKTRFLSQMSHEIRTPLNAVLGMNDLIMSETDNETIRQYAGNIKNAGKTLLSLINDILDFSKIETGKMEIFNEDYSLSSLVNDIVFMIQMRAKEKDLELLIDVEPQIPDGLNGDEVRIKQIVLNLLTNAVKYTNEGWINFKVSMVRTSKEELMLYMQVSDSGIGIKKEELPKLFDDFERLDQIKNRRIEGSGLGLSIASQFVKLMRGKISVESEYGKGSTFVVVIPQRIIRDEAVGDYKKRFAFQKQEDNEKKQEKCSFAGKSVFVVDDNEMNLEVLEAILKMMDLTVDKAMNGKEALAKLKKKKYGLILTDDMMPDMSGTELMKKLSGSKEYINCNTPIVVLTANAIGGAREDYIKKGFDDYMTKPIDIDLLQKILKRYLL